MSTMMHGYPMPTASPTAGQANTARKTSSTGSAPGSFDAATAHMRTPPQQHISQTTPPGMAGQTLVMVPPLQQPPPYKSVKRPRPVKSCTECRKRKLRCDRLLPCSQCQKSTRNCRYAADHDPANLSDASDTEPTDAVRPLKRACPPSTSNANNASVASETAVTPAKNGGSPGLSGLEELTLRMERLERHMQGRSPAPTETSGMRVLYAADSTIRGLSVKRGGMTTRFFGQHAPRVMLNLFPDARAYLTGQYQKHNVNPLLRNFGLLHKHRRRELHHAMMPITVFVDSMMPVQKRMRDILPKKEICDRLVRVYFDTSESIYRILHIQMFYEAYGLFWEGKLDSDVFLPQLLCVLSVASRFETKSKGMGHERSEGVHIPTACALIQSWLDSLRGKQLADISAVQVQVLLIHASRMITPRLQDSWNKLGYVIRLAMSMGMHRDPSEFEPRIPVFWGEMRRRLWFTLADMDLHMSISCNMPSLLRDGDFTCRPPRNLNDSELFPNMHELPQTKSIDQTTDNQMQTYAAITLAARMRVAPLVNRIDSLRDYSEVLDVGTKLERFLDDINYIFPRQGSYNVAQKNKQWRSRVILDMHVRRPLLALYRPLALGTTDVPAEVSRSFLKSCVVILKYLDELDPSLREYNGVAEMYHQILKPDIIYSSLSVCYYIQTCRRHNSDTLIIGGHPGATHMSGEGSDDLSLVSGENVTPWSLVGLMATVQESLDLLIRCMSGSDTRDILCVAAVLQTVSNVEFRVTDTTIHLKGVFDACLRSSGLTMDKLTESLVDHYSGPDPYSIRGGTHHDYSANGVRGGSSGNDMDGWVIWEGWD